MSPKTIRFNSTANRSVKRTSFWILSWILAITVWSMPSCSAESAVKIPAPVVDETLSNGSSTETAVLAGGCFWGVQAVFQHTQGVTQVLSGYSGGAQATAQYETVSQGTTGHAESVKITYDPKRITYGKLLQIYFSVAHNPTQLNRQGPDSGPQYRSAIFYQNADQKHVAESYIAQLEAGKVYPAHVVTQLTPFTAFYPAEAYHQDFATLHPNHGYIARFDLPKIENLKQMFPSDYREKPVTVSAIN